MGMNSTHYSMLSKKLWGKFSMAILVTVFKEKKKRLSPNAYGYFL